MNTHADLDMLHITTVCDETIIRARSGARGVSYDAAETAPDGVLVRFTTREDRDLAQAGLQAVGYHAHAIPDDPSKLRVTGWSTELLRNRMTALRSTIDHLLDTFEATAVHAIDTYRGAEDRATDPEAQRRSAWRTENELHRDAARRIGPLVNKKLEPPPSDPGVVMLIEQTKVLYWNVTRLLLQHAELAREVIGRFAHDSRHMSDDDAAAHTLATLQSEIADSRESVERSIDDDLFQDAETWVTRHANELAFGFACWITDRYQGRGHHCPPMDQMFERWCRTGFTDNRGVPVLPHAPHSTATTPSQRAATDIRVTRAGPPPAGTEGDREQPAAPGSNPDPGTPRPARPSADPTRRGRSTR